MNNITRTITLAIVTLFFFNGCSVVKDSMRVSEKNSTWNPIESLTEKRQNANDEVLPPMTMAAIWNFGIYEKPGSESVRGLGGRLYLYDANNNPVAAEGELIVYGFDEENGNKTKPDKKFIFRESELQSHYSESALGGSYSIWIPWDKVGGYRKSVTLLPVFKSKDGRVIRSEQSINLLAGKTKKQDSADSKHPYRVLGSSSAVLSNPSDNRPASVEHVQASFEQSEGEGGSDSGEFSQQIRTTSISLTPNLQRQVKRAGQIRTGEQPFAAASTAGSTAMQNVAKIPTTVESNDIKPVSRTSTTESVFGRPGTFR